MISSDFNGISSMMLYTSCVTRQVFWNHHKYSQQPWFTRKIIIEIRRVKVKVSKRFVLLEPFFYRNEGRKGGRKERREEGSKPTQYVRCEFSCRYLCSVLTVALQFGKYFTNHSSSTNWAMKTGRGVGGGAGVGDLGAGGVTTWTLGRLTSFLIGLRGCCGSRAVGDGCGSGEAGGASGSSGTYRFMYSTRKPSHKKIKKSDIFNRSGKKMTKRIRIEICVNQMHQMLNSGRDMKKKSKHADGRLKSS